jgi:hypothetical protein
VAAGLEKQLGQARTALDDVMLLGSPAGDSPLLQILQTKVQIQH